MDRDPTIRPPAETVVVTRAPGPLQPLVPAGRDRDDLDDLIDDLLPEITERAGWFDAALVAAGVGLTGWAMAGGPTVAAVVGLVTLVLGCVLPPRSLWRRARSRRDHRRLQDALDTGLPLVVSPPSTGRLRRSVRAAIRPRRRSELDEARQTASG